MNSLQRQWSAIYVCTQLWCSGFQLEGRSPGILSSPPPPQHVWQSWVEIKHYSAY